MQILKTFMMVSLFSYVGAVVVPAEHVSIKRQIFSGVRGLKFFDLRNLRSADLLEQFCIVEAGGPGKCRYDPDEGVSLDVRCDDAFPVSVAPFGFFLVVMVERFIILLCRLTQFSALTQMTFVSITTRIPRAQPLVVEVVKYWQIFPLGDY